MDELIFSFKMKGWRNISIKIIDEELFKEKFDNFCENVPQGEFGSYYDFLEECMNDCVEEINDSLEFEDWNKQWDQEEFEVLSEHLI